MVDPAKVLNVRKSNEYQLNVSVKREYAQEVADAIDFMLRQDPYKSKSELACQALIAYAEDQRAQQPEPAPDGRDGRAEAEAEAVS